MDEQTLVDKRALDALTENYESFTLEDKDGHEAELHLYPLQLGRLAMISRRLINLDMALSGNAENDVMKMWRICADKPHEVAEIIAIEPYAQNRMLKMSSKPGQNLSNGPRR